MRIPENVTRFLRASGVGALASAVDLGVLVALVHLAGLSAAAANLPSLLAGAVVQFVGARFVVFDARSGALGPQLRRFALAEAGTLLLNALLFMALTHWTPLPVAAARLLATGLVFAGYSFPVWNGVFRSKTVEA
jgi:putative flippase GtrA